MSFNARHEYTGPAASYAFTFGYLDATHVKAYVAGVLDAGRTLSGASPESGGDVILSVTPGASDEVVIVRETPSGALVDFQSTALLTEEDLDTANKQSLFVAEEADDTAALSLTTANAVTATVTAAEVAAQAAQAAAETAQTNAETAETNAAASAAAASTSAGNAATSETNAAASAAAAASVVSGMMTFQGTFDASGGSLPANVTDTDFWYVSGGGSAGGFTFVAGDMLIYNVGSYYKIDNTEPDSLFRDGSLAMTGDLDMGGNNITNGGSASFSGTGVASQGIPLVTDATTTRTLALSDNGSYIRFTSGSATTCTVPLNSSVAFPTGSEIVLFQGGAGQVTIAATGGVTINSKDGNLNLTGQYSSATLKKVSTDTWDLIGDLSA